jgi:hypothetical protein
VEFNPNQIVFMMGHNSDREEVKVSREECHQELNLMETQPIIQADLEEFDNNIFCLISYKLIFSL